MGLAQIDLRMFQDGKELRLRMLRLLAYDKEVT